MENPHKPELEIDEETLTARHKKEQKELQSKIQALKKSCAKGDKKRKKEITEEVAKLEADLQNKHTAELELFQQYKGQDLVQATENLNISSSNDEQADRLESRPRVTKAQRRREKKSEKERDREIRIAQQAEENKLGPRHIEEVTIKELLSSKNLALHEVPSDGNCLYSAIAHQLSALGEVALANVGVLRQATAEQLRAHIEDFRPFTTHPNTGSELSEQEYQEYCNRTESDTSAWGGQIELQALVEALKRPIEVLQAEGPAVILGDQFQSKKPIILTYHRHAFGLGEHYNSVRDKTSQTIDN